MKQVEAICAWSKLGHLGESVGINHTLHIFILVMAVAHLDEVELPSRNIREPGDSNELRMKKYRTILFQEVFLMPVKM